MVEMGQERSFRFEVLDDGKGFVKAKMRGMGLYPDAIEDENVQVAKQIHRRGRDDLEICRIGKIVKTVCDHRQFAMDDLNGGYLETRSDAKRGVGLDRMRYQLRQAAADVCWLENVLKYSPEVSPRDLVSKDSHRTKPKIQRADIVEAEDVIDMAMRDQNSIEMSDIGPECLLTKVDRGIDKNACVLVFNEYRNPQPFITGILG